MKNKVILSIVLNTLNNDSRVLRIGEALKNVFFDFSFLAVNNKKPMEFYYKDFFKQMIVYRIYEKDLSKLKNDLVKYLEWQFLVRLRLYRALSHLLKTKKFNLIYCNDFDTLVITYLFKKRYNFKIIYDSHELWTERKGAKKTIIHRFVNSIESKLEKYIIKRCDAVITVSEGIAKELSKRYNIKKPYVIRNLDEIREIPSYQDRMMLRDKLNIPRNAILLIYQGGLADARGIPELIEAMDKLPKNIHLLLMGKYLSENSSKMLKRNNRIHYIGMIPQEELFYYTAIGDIGVVPTRISNILNHKLAFPNKFSQYMNAGLVLALYKTEESEKVIKQCKCGVVFEPESSKNIISAVGKIIKSGNIEEYKKRSREAFLKYYNWEMDKYKLIKIIKDL